MLIPSSFLWKVLIGSKSEIMPKLSSTLQTWATSTQSTCVKERPWVPPSLLALLSFWLLSSLFGRWLWYSFILVLISECCGVYKVSSFLLHQEPQQRQPNPSLLSSSEHQQAQARRLAYLQLGCLPMHRVMRPFPLFLLLLLLLHLLLLLLFMSNWDQQC